MLPLLAVDFTKFNRLFVPGGRGSVISCVVHEIDRWTVPQALIDRHLECFQ